MRQSAERVLIGWEGINHCRNRDATLNNVTEMLRRKAVHVSYMLEIS